MQRRRWLPIRSVLRKKNKMPSPIDHRDHYHGYQVSLSCVQRGGLWKVAGITIVRSGTLTPLFPRRALPGQSPDADHAVQRGMGWARAVIDNLDPGRLVEAV
ncbi:hypothetical protein Hsero_0361 [Herbaspirillum seropedicae SmR1]|uniref:Uncharacterized protein n=2 Tax=Herbaspirillum seropedicae TaxID=964 RepID=D8IW89_HERSS|nr:hypothetical protein Hsero_0361 [Herbaspirillum seropedicae SmR1]